MLRVSHRLPTAASPTSEFKEKEIETLVALLQKGISIWLFLGYRYHLTGLPGKARSAVKGSECLEMERRGRWVCCW